MIVIKLMGGLGNQMFQYAFGEALKEKYGFNVKFDKYWFDLPEIDEQVTKWPYELRIFDFELITIKSKYIPFYYKVLNKFSKNKNKHIVDYNTQKSIIDQLLNGENSKSYLEGYWQNVACFLDSKNEISNFFPLKTKLDERNEKIIALMKNQKSVSLHIRRGDYTTQKVDAFLKNYEKYYSDAVSYISSKVENPIFYVFSDDIEWVKENIKIEYETRYISHNSMKDSYKDMILMSNCKHNIIANSTFSWWGSVLNKNPNKMVVMPKKWNPKLKFDTYIEL